MSTRRKSVLVILGLVVLAAAGFWAYVLYQVAHSTSNWNIWLGLTL
jgi:hypothetical protein